MAKMIFSNYKETLFNTKIKNLDKDEESQAAAINVDYYYIDQYGEQRTPEMVRGRWLVLWASAIQPLSTAAALALVLLGGLSGIAS